MVDQDDMLLNVCINYNNKQIIFDRTNDLPSIDELKNKIMKKLEIPNTKDYLYLSYKDDKGSVQKIGEDKNLFNYTKEKEYSHQKEYILELDLSIRDNEKFKKFFNGVIDENKYNEQQIELEKIKRENEIFKKKIEEMEKSKTEEMENVRKAIKEIKEMKETIIIKERKNKKLQIELLKKGLENKKLYNYINELLKKKEKEKNIFFKARNQIFENGEKKKEDIINDQNNNIKNFKAAILKYIYDLNEGMKELNEKNIKLPKNTSQQTKKDSEKDKSLNNSNKKDSFQIDIKLMGEYNKKYEDVNIKQDNKQKIESDINGPQDNQKNRNIKNNVQKKNININDDELFKNDKFYIFLNKIFFKKNLNDLENECKIFISKFKSPKGISIKKFDYFYDKKILPILQDNNDKDILKKNDFRDKTNKILEILKKFDKRIESKKSNQDNKNSSQNLTNNNYQF
jgi:hypothetical protein